MGCFTYQNHGTYFRTMGHTSCGTPERHRLFSEHEKRTSRGLGAAPPDPKPVPPPRKSLEIPPWCSHIFRAEGFPPPGSPGRCTNTGRILKKRSGATHHSGCIAVSWLRPRSVLSFVVFSSYACALQHVDGGFPSFCFKGCPRHCATLIFGWPLRLLSSADFVRRLRSQIANVFSPLRAVGVTASQWFFGSSSSSRLLSSQIQPFHRSDSERGVSVPRQRALTASHRRSTRRAIWVDCQGAVH